MAYSRALFQKRHFADMVDQCIRSVNIHIVYAEYPESYHRIRQPLLAGIMDMNIHLLTGVERPLVLSAFTDEFHLLHTRKAEARTFEILQEMGVTKADFHCFCGKAKLGKKVRAHEVHGRCRGDGVSSPRIVPLSSSPP